MTHPHPQATPPAPALHTTPNTPLLSDEELDALIQAFNRRDSSPVRPLAVRAWLGCLALTMLGWAGWWWWA